MPFPFFPFDWGSVPAPVVVTPPPAAPPPLWGSVAAVQHSWNDLGVKPTPFRMERVYGQIPDFQTEQVECAHRVQQQFPFIVSTGNQIYLRSAITNP